MSRRRHFKARTERYSPLAGTATQDATEPYRRSSTPTDDDRLSPKPEPTRGEAACEHASVACARQRLALQKQAVGEHHPDYATGLNQLAMLLIMHGQPDQAEPLLRQALEIRQETLGERHRDYATNLSSLGGLLWARGDLDGAEPLMRQALDIRWDVFGSTHPKTISTLNSLEQLLRSKQDWEGIERLAATPLAANLAVAPVAATVASPSAMLNGHDTPPADASMAPTGTNGLAESELPVPPPPAVTASGDADDIERREETTAPPTQEPSDDHVESRPVVSRSAPGGVETRTREELIGRQEGLAAQFRRVGEQLAREAEEWKSGGTPPSPALIAGLDSCGRDFEQLRGEVVRLADSLGAAIEPSQLTNLDEIASHLEILGEAEGRQAQLEAIRTQALATLDRVLTLSVADGNAFAPLVACQAKARAERANLADAPVLQLPDQATRLAEGDHPFHSLLVLVEEDGLSDDYWAALLEAVEAEFGKALSVAVARSKVVQP